MESHFPGVVSTYINQKMNTSLTVQDFNHSAESPFDSIRRIDEHGNEFWFARELQPILGYTKWDKFKSVIDNAIENIGTVTGSAVDHFFPVEVKNIDADGNRLRGRAGSDYKLSRLACYHVALCCDSRGNNQVKAAKHYFAVKTREAELVIPSQNERIYELELRLKIAELEKATSDNHTYLLARSEFIATTQGPQMLALIQGRPDAVVEVKETVTETIVCRDGRNVSFEGKSTAEVGRELGFKTGKQLQSWLEKHGHGHLICEGLRAVGAPYIPTENLPAVKQIWSQFRNKDDRQLFLGE